MLLAVKKEGSEPREAEDREVIGRSEAGYYQQLVLSKEYASVHCNFLSTFL